MKYREYTAEDFANDSFFIRWVNRPDEESEWFWRAFLKENPQCADEVERARTMILLLDFPAHPVGEKEMLRMRNGLLLALRAEREELSDKTTLRVLNVAKKKRLWLKVAASLAVVVCAFLGGYHFFKDGRDVVALLPPVRATGFEERINPSGQKSVLYLSDGTKVWLNAASRITYASHFGAKDTRDVYLEGEAFFDVAHDESKPFIVHTSSIMIKVLGTSFNVKSYAEEKTIETTLVEGKVRIEPSGEKSNSLGNVELKPNQRAVFDKESKTINIDVVGANIGGRWKEDRMVFDEESIDNVILQIERWFNVKIHVENRGRLNCKLTASIDKESLHDVLELIETSHNVRYSIVGNDVFIKGSLCNIENNEK